MEEYSTMGGYYPFPSAFDAMATGVASAAPLPSEHDDDDGNWTTSCGGAGLLSDALLYRPTKKVNTSTAGLDNSSGLPKLRPDSDSPCTIERLPWSLRFGEGEEEDGELDDGVSAIPSSCGDSIWNMSSGESEGNTTHMNTTTITQPNYTPNPNEAISLPSNKRPSSRGNSNAATFEITFGRPEAKRSRLPEENPAHVEAASSRSIDFRHQSEKEEIDPEALAQVKEMIYRAAAFRPVVLGAEETVEKPKRKNVRISSDPQTVAARHRRERISERLRVLQRLVPGGSKLDTATMLDEAANYLKFLKSQVMALEKNGGSTAAGNDVIACGLLANAATSAAPSALSSTLTSTFLPQPPTRINPNVRGSMQSIRPQ